MKKRGMIYFFNNISTYFYTILARSPRLGSLMISDKKPPSTPFNNITSQRIYKKELLGLIYA